MVDFNQETRKRCQRCRKCRSKLPIPTSNDREAFCTRGCHSAFYRTRCRVCENPIEQPKNGGARFICKKSKCFNAWKANSGFGRYHPSSGVKSDSKTPIKPHGFEPHKPGRPWFIVTGPELTRSQLHCATVGDGEVVDGKPTWNEGSYERLEAHNRRTLEAAEKAEIEANGYFTDPDWRKIISPDGVRCLVTRFAKAPETKRRAMPPIPDDLSLPAFLCRQLPQALEQALAA
jgi:hypothetical protein